MGIPPQARGLDAGRSGRRGGRRGCGPFHRGVRELCPRLLRGAPRLSARQVDRARLPSKAPPGVLLPLT